MALYLVRHAQAGNRDRWLLDGHDDSLRPLSDAGHRQARRLVSRFEGVPVSQALSSPYLRCVQTLEPLAHHLGLAVTPTPELAEGGSFLAVVELLARVPDHTVLCSHGDVIPEVIAALYRRGMSIDSPEDWRKGSTWVVERDGDSFTSATVIAPPPKD